MNNHPHADLVGRVYRNGPDGPKCVVTRVIESDPEFVMGEAVHSDHVSTALGAFVRDFLIDDREGKQ